MDAIIVRPELGGGESGPIVSQSLGGGVLCDEPGLMGGGFRPSKFKFVSKSVGLNDPWTDALHMGCLRGKCQDH